MQLVPSAIQLSFEATFNMNNLNVGMVVYDTTGTIPVEVLAPTAMTNVYGNTYLGKFSPSTQKNYLIVKSVYTDNTLTTLDAAYVSQSETVVAELLGTFGQVSLGTPVIGIVSESVDVSSQGVFNIFTGDDKTIYLKAIQGSLTGDPLNLGSCTEIDILLPNADGTVSHRLLSLSQVTIVSPAVLGKFYCDIPSAISSLLNIGQLQSFDVTFTISGAPFTVRYYSAFSVFET